MNEGKGKLSIKCCNYCWILTRLERMEETSMKEIKTIKQYSKLISIEHAGMNEADRHFEDLEYLNTINIQYSEILSNITERGFWKLYPLELIIDARLERSTFIHFKSCYDYFALSTNMNYHHISNEVQI